MVLPRRTALRPCDPKTARLPPVIRQRRWAIFQANRRRNTIMKTQCRRYDRHDDRRCGLGLRHVMVPDCFDHGGQPRMRRKETIARHQGPPTRPAQPRAKLRSQPNAACLSLPSHGPGARAAGRNRQPERRAAAATDTMTSRLRLPPNHLLLNAGACGRADVPAMACPHAPSRTPATRARTPAAGRPRVPPIHRGTLPAAWRRSARSPAPTARR